MFAVPAALAAQDVVRGPFQLGLQLGTVSHSLLGTADGTLVRADADDLALDVDIRGERSMVLGGFVARRVGSSLTLRVRIARTSTHMAIDALGRPLSGPGVQTFSFDGLGEVELWLAGGEVVWEPVRPASGPRPYLVVGVGASRWTITGLEELDFPPLLEAPVSFDPVETTLPSLTLGGGVAFPLGERAALIVEVSDFVSGNPFQDDDFRIGSSFSGVGRAQDLVHSLKLTAGLRLVF